MKSIILLLLTGLLFLFAKEQHAGKVLEVLQSGPYTYLKIKEHNPDKTVWIAVTRIPVTKGAEVTFHEAMTMDNFKSKTLGRTFKHLIFADGIRFATEKKKRQLPSLARKLKQTKISPYKKPGTLSVEELFMNAKKLNGKRVKVRGKVIKVAREIMKRDWVHIEDGTGDANAGTDDLVFTTPKADVKRGDIVTAEGIVAVEKDFGYGYFYPVIVEKSHFTKDSNSSTH